LEEQFQILGEKMLEKTKEIVGSFYDFYLLRDLAHTFTGGLLVTFLLYNFYPKNFSALTNNPNTYKIIIFIVISYFIGIIHQEIILLPHRYFMLKLFQNNKKPIYTNYYFFFRTSTDCDSKTEDLCALYNDIYKGEKDENGNIKQTVINEYLVNTIILEELGNSARRTIERTIYLKQLSIELGGVCLTVFLILLFSGKLTIFYMYALPTMAIFCYLINNYFVNYQIIQYIHFFEHIKRLKNQKKLRLKKNNSIR